MVKVEYAPVAQLDRALDSDSKGHWFESSRAYHVGTSCARSDFLFHKKSVTRSTVPPFPQKVTLRLRCSLVNALTTLRLAVGFLRVATTAPYWHLFCSVNPG